MKKQAKNTASKPAALAPATPEKVSVAPILTGPLSENVVFDGVSMTFKQGTTLEQWEAVGLGLAQSSKVSQWCLGDWLNYGTGAFKKDYKTACAKTGLAYGTLRTAASVAKRFAPAKRRLTVSFEHHRLLAPVKDEDKVKTILDRVEKEDLSAAAMKELIPKETPKPLTPEQQEARDIAESTRQREHAENLMKWLKAVYADPKRRTRLGMWPTLLQQLHDMPWSALLKTAKVEGQAAADKDPITGAK